MAKKDGDKTYTPWEIINPFMTNQDLYDLFRHYLRQWESSITRGVITHDQY